MGVHAKELKFVKSFLLITLLLKVTGVELQEEKFINEDSIKLSLFPDIDAIRPKFRDNEMIAQFFDYFNHAGIQTEKVPLSKRIPFVIIVPNVPVKPNQDLSYFIKQHIVPSSNLAQLKNGAYVGNLNGNFINIEKSKKSHQMTVNGRNVLSIENPYKVITILLIDGSLDENHLVSAKIVSETEASTIENLHPLVNNKTNNSVNKHVNKNQLQHYLSTSNLGTKIFEHFLNASGLNQIFDNSSSKFIVFIPSDSAFQRWHPVDWGFFPFSVPEFTESILKNHIVSQKKVFDVNTKKQKFETLGGEFINYENINNRVTVNNISVISNVTLSKGHTIFVISEILFMSDSIVSKLHSQNKDKETPPLLAFPWFASQFLSHTYLALERDPRFTHITRFLSNSEISSYILGANYTFFVPNDDAFEKYRLNELSDDAISSNETLKFLLNHFVNVRLYKRDLKDGTMLKNVNGETLNFKNQHGTFKVNEARIIESEVFVYNLGTMYFIDDILFPETLSKTNNDNSVPNLSAETIIEEEDEFFTTEIPIRNRNSLTSLLEGNEDVEILTNLESFHTNVGSGNVFYREEKSKHVPKK